MLDYGPFDFQKCLYYKKVFTLCDISFSGTFYCIIFSLYCHLLPTFRRQWGLPNADSDLLLNFNKYYSKYSGFTFVALLFPWHEFQSVKYLIITKVTKIYTQSYFCAVWMAFCDQKIDRLPPCKLMTRSVNVPNVGVREVIWIWIRWKGSSYSLIWE